MGPSPHTFPLLRLLGDGKLHSGHALAAALGVTPAELRGALRSAAVLGVDVRTVRGRGLHLAVPLDLLDVKRLNGLSLPEFPVEVIDECASTNAVLMERARCGSEQALALVSERQTAGRGRRGKRWESGIGTDLTFSVLWRFPHGTGALSGLSLAVGVALARALERLGYEGVQLKWPNDLMLRGRKLGGVLIEVGGDATGSSAVVVGIGVNVHRSEARAAVVEQPATDLQEAGGSAVSRTDVLCALLGELHGALAKFARVGFGPFRAEWLHYHAWQGRRVTLRLEQQTIAEGEAVGIGEDGALLLRSASGLEEFRSGELRLAG